MDYTNNYAQIGGYGMSMTPPQLFYPEMNGSQGYEQGSAMDILKPRYDSYYKDDYKQSEERVRGVRNNYYDGGDYEHGQKGEAIDLNHFYDGGDFKHPQENRRDSHNVDYGSQHYVANSASGYRSYARQTRRDREMLARNGLYSPRDGCSRRNEYPSYNDDTGHSSSRNSYWHKATESIPSRSRKAYLRNLVSEKTDIYSFGIVIWEETSDKGEVKCLLLANHENIVKLFGFTKTADFKTIIAMEYADCGSVYNFLHDKEIEKQVIQASDFGKLNWMLQCAKGVAYLHDLDPKILHRDIKSSNLLLFNKYLTLKICDFGTSRPLATVMSGQVGTAGYMAPEVCRGESYTEKCDVYSFGIVCWEIMSQKKPFYHVQNRNFLAIFNLSVDKNERPPIDDVKVFDEKTKNMKILIQECWDKDATVRPTMKELVIRLGEDCKHNGSEDIDGNTRRVVGTTRLPPSPRPPFVMILVLILMELKALKPN
ncbi:hypothetical protein ACLKA6_011322 [Drosophila palustris]